MTDRSRVLVALRVRATPARAFAAFTEEIGSWWRPNGVFEFTRGRRGVLAFEPGSAGRLVERYEDGTQCVIGEVAAWEPPHRLVVSWRQAGMGPDEETELHVRFDEAGDETRVTVEHFGWDGVPVDHVARHGFPLPAIQQRFAEWWQGLLVRLSVHIES